MLYAMLQMPLNKTVQYKHMTRLRDRPKDSLPPCKVPVHLSTCMLHVPLSSCQQTGCCSCYALLSPTSALQLRLAVLQIKLGDWYDKEGKDRKIATQYHEVMGGFSYKWLGRFSRLVIIIALGGDALAQIIASSSNFHTFIPSVNKRWVLAMSHAHE